jgi:hypothetical protein
LLLFLSCQARATLLAETIEAEARDVKARAEANAIILKAEAEAKAIEVIGAAEAEAKTTLMDALSYTPAPEWIRQLQVASAGSLDGMTVSVTPEGLPSLLAALNAGSAMFAGMRGQAIEALEHMPAVFNTGAAAGEGEHPDAAV